MSDFAFNQEYELSKLASIVSDKIEADKVTLSSYISTDNMIADRGGVKSATKLPSASKFNHFAYGDTLFSNIRTYFKKVWLATFEGGASPDVLIFRTDYPEILDPYYLYFLLSSEDFINYTVLTAKGAKMPRGDKDAIMQYRFFLPDIKKQREIGLSLLKMNKKIELNRQINQTLEQIAQVIFKSWFVDFEPTRAKVIAKEKGANATIQELAAQAIICGAMTLAQLKDCEQDLEVTLKQTISQKLTQQNGTPINAEQLKTTAALFPNKLVDSELGEIPEEWEVRKLKDICRVLNGRAYKNNEFKEEGMPIVRIQNLSSGGRGGKTVYSDLKLPIDKRINKEDFIYAWSATFGPHIWRGPESIYHYHIWKMDVDEEVISRYFLYLSMFRKTEQMKSGATGSIFTHLTKGIMESQEILLASNELNMHFKKLLEYFFLKISVLNDEIITQENIRDSLLPKLLSGELSVSGVTLDD